MNNMKKAVLAVAGAVVVAVHEVLGQGPWTPVKTLLVLLALFTAVTVYVAPNLPKGNGVGTWTKAFVALAVAGIEVTIPLLNDSAITQSEWLVIAMAVLTAAGVPILRGPRLKPAPPSGGGAHPITSLPE